MIREADVVLEDLEGLTPVLYRAFEHAAQKARDYFEEGGLPFDKYMFAHQMRYHAKHYLAMTGQQVQDIALDNLANMGLALRYARYPIRIRKGDGANLPAPGRSVSMQMHYRQLRLQLAEEEGIAEFLLPNLLVLWHVNRRHNLLKLTLACPRDSENRRDSATYYWHVDIPHPANFITSDEAWDDDEDLDIDLRENLENDVEGNVG